jgi:NADPH-dependent 2,4-dienoyl-CoA reductase/sulfur reductase-like enzyme
MGSVVARLHEQAGVELLCGIDIEGFNTEDNSVTHVRLADGRVLPADIVVVGIGAQPNVAWLEGSGIDVGNGVVCDAAGRTTVPGVVAVGDCAAWLDTRTGQHRRVEHWAGAVGRPAVAVGALLDHDDAYLPVEQPYFWSCQYGARLQFVGDMTGSDRVIYEHGGPGEESFLAVYYAGDDPVAVLGWNQPKQFTRWRKFLAKLAVSSAEQRLIA